MSSKIKVDTIENVAGSGNVSLGSGHNLVVPGTSSIAGHASIGVNAVSNTRALTVAGATDGSGSSALVVYNSSLASKFAVRDDGLTTITDNATVGGTLGVTGASTFSGSIAKVSSGLSADVDIHVKTASGNPQMRVESTGANYVTYSLKNSARNYSTQIRTDQSNSYVVRDETGGGNRLLISTAGIVTMPSQPAFAAVRTAGDTTSNVEFVYNSVIFNNGSHYNSSNGRFTAPIAGRYHFNVMMSHNGAGTGASGFFRPSINGSTGTYLFPIYPNIDHLSICFSFTLNLNASDYVSIFSGTALTVLGSGNCHNHFSGFLVG